MPRVELVSEEEGTRMRGTTGPQARRALMHRPRMADAIGLLNDACFASALPARLNELVRYRIALLNDCVRCQAYRSQEAREAGVTGDLLDRVEDWRTESSFSTVERDAIDYAERFVIDPSSVDDALVGRLRATLGDEGVIDLSVCVGKYVMLGRILVTLDLDQDLTAGVAPLISGSRVL
jgi:AhpD family alkylhydroperoxidase